MNIDDGRIRLWADLSDSEKDSGRWVKLGEGELARAETIEERDRAKQLDEIFGKIVPLTASIRRLEREQEAKREADGHQAGAGADMRESR